jgi:hypothetical protein
MRGPETYVGQISEVEAMPFTHPYTDTEAWAEGVTIYDEDGEVCGLLIPTPNGARVAAVGDYIIRTPFFTDHFPPTFFEDHYRLFRDPTPLTREQATTPKEVHA